MIEGEGEDGHEGDGLPFDAVVDIELHERFLKEIIHLMASQRMSPQRAASMIVRTFEKRAEGSLCTVSAMSWLRKDILEEYSSEMGLSKEQCVRLSGADRLLTLLVPRSIAIRSWPPCFGYGPWSEPACVLGWLAAHCRQLPHGLLVPSGP